MACNHWRHIEACEPISSSLGIQWKVNNYSLSCELQVLLLFITFWKAARNATDSPATPSEAQNECADLGVRHDALLCHSQPKVNGVLAVLSVQDDRRALPVFNHP
eukprot:6474796-Amphidinium_carterae.1